VIAAFFISCLLSFVGSMPIAGPIAAIVLSKGLHNEPRAGLFIALGAAIAESVYAGLAFLGLTAMLARYPVLLPLSRLVGCLLLSGLGAYFILRPSRPQRAGPATETPRTGTTTAVGNALLGVSITALNPTLIVTWTAAVGAAHVTGLLRVCKVDALPFAGGVAAGIVAWFATLLALLGRFRRRLRPESVSRVIRTMGILLLVGGVLYGVRTVVLWGGAP
jgi:threonine/homoserine/homoserine lactone efflux protein